MKRVILMCMLWASLNSYGQEWTKKINDPDFHNRRSKGLKVGDKMPDLLLGDVYNNKTGKTRFSEFEGKLVILDFWMTWCPGCILGFPKMELLQKEFGDKIQIILVNPFETIEEVRKVNPNLKLPDLPSIMKDANGNSEKLIKFFPSVLGHQVWIDQKGVIRLRGSSFNNTSKQIGDFLNGKEVVLLNDNATVPKFDQNYPYSKLLGDFKKTSTAYGSFFTPFNNEYAPEGGVGLGIVDTVSATIRNTFINVEPIRLFELAYDTELTDDAVNILYHYNSWSQGNLPRFILPKDTLRYASILQNGSLGRNTEEYVKAKVCYEQIVPLKMSKEQQKVYMQQDLNRYFGSLYGMEAKVEKRIVPCYVLVRTSIKDKLESKSTKKLREEKVRKRKKMITYHKTRLGILREIIRQSSYLSSFLAQNAGKNAAAFLIDETGFDRDKKIDLIIPDSNDLKTIEDLREALRPYDLNIISTERRVQFVVIDDNSNK